MSATTKLGHGLARVFGIKLEYRDEGVPKAKREALSRGESVFSVQSADSYNEDEPRTMDWIREVTPGPRNILNYFIGLFPFIKWIHRYNFVWLAGDLIAGITVGAVVVPQSLSYATLAELEPQYGLYSAFMGVFLYWFFATSKDITIGPVAVMSQIVGNIVLEVQAGLPYYAQPHVIASAVAVLVGAIIFTLGMLRLGFIVEFIPLTAVASFITGAALNIISGQVVTLLGVDSDLVDTHGPTYMVIIQTLHYLPTATIDAAIGMTALFLLYLIRFTVSTIGRKFPKYEKACFYINTLRIVFVLLLYVLIGWASTHHISDAEDNASISLVGTVPRGFVHHGAPTGLRPEIITLFASKLPAVVIVAIIEHIAISKQFGRINNYVINPSQEFIAIGVTNLLGPFVGAYPATGSFSRTAIKSKAGVRTPIAGIFTAIVVLLAIYVLPPLFYWIPKASLAAVIIHAVGDLFTPPNTLYQFWKVNPIEVVIFFLGLIGSIFSKVETGVYVTVSVSAAVLLFRAAKAQGRFLGKVKVHSVIGDHYLEEDKKTGGDSINDTDLSRTIFLPMDHNDGSNPHINLTRPYPGVFIYRFSEGFNYPNAGRYLEWLVEVVMRECRRTVPIKYSKPGERPWNNPGPKKGQAEPSNHELPTLKAVILDFSSVNNIDVTSIQYLIDIRNQLDRFAAPDPVEWHIASVNNRWTKRGLVSAGFGYPVPTSTSSETHRWKPIYNVAEFEHGGSTAAEAAERRDNKRMQQQHPDIEAQPRAESNSDDGLKKEGATTEVHTYSGGAGNKAVIGGVNRPFFHPDLHSALNSAIAGIEDKRRAGVLHENEF